MKSSDNTLLLAGLFVLIVVIIALIVYYTRPGETKISDQVSDDNELKIENLTFERTLNPDPSVGNGVSGYTIEPYGIEYAGSADYKELSRNVTFTMKWSNAPGFNATGVKGFEIEHWVRDISTTAATKYTNPKTYKYYTENDPVSPIVSPLVKFKDFKKNSMGMVCSDANVTTGNPTVTDAACEYSVVGDNAFVLYAVVQKKDTVFAYANKATHTRVILYNGIGDNLTTADKLADNHALKISTNQLSVTLSMTTPDTLTFTPIGFTTSSRVIIDKTTYSISSSDGAEVPKRTTLTQDFTGYNGGVYLTTLEGSGGKRFTFTFEDGDILGYKSDNTFVKQSPATIPTTTEKFIFEVVDRENTKGKIRQAASRFLGGTAKTVAEGPETITTTTMAEKDRKYLSVDSSGKLKLYTQIDSALDQKIFNGFTWAFDKRISKALPMPDNNGVSGNVVCISGDDAFVGQPTYGSNTAVPVGLGRVIVYRRNSKGVWQYKKTFDSSSVGATPAPYLYGSSIAIDGDYAVIGEKLRRSGSLGIKAGRIHVFKKGADGEWNTTKNKTPYAPEASFSLDSSGSVIPYAYFGYSVAISGKFIVVGAPFEDHDNSTDNGLIGKGAVYLFKIKENTVKTEIELEFISKVGGKTLGERFGHAIDISGDRVIVGAPHKGGVSPDTDRGQDWIGACDINNGKVDFCPNEKVDKNPAKTGSVSIYKIGRDDENKEKLILEREMNPGAFSNQPSGDTRFGESVAIDGMIAVIGMPGKKGFYTVQNDNANVGCVYVLKGDGDRKLDNKNRPMPQLRWGLQFAEMISDSDGKRGPAIPGRRKNGEFGKSVSISDGKICIGEPGGKGAVYVYKHKLFGPNKDYFYGRDDNDTSDPPPESRITLELIKTYKSPAPLTVTDRAFGKAVSISDGYAMIGEPISPEGVGNVGGSIYITAV